RKPTAKELADLVFGWAVEQGVTSNSVLFVKNGATVAIGAGGQDRVGIVEATIFKAYRNFSENISFKKHKISYKELLLQQKRGEINKSFLKDIDEETKKAKANLLGAVMISDAFFPFRDGLDVALKEGISAVAHPGGSLRDFEGILAVNEAKPPAAMVFTGQRAFKH
ncbi:MAG: IMP cyclohydrolase, partial [Candidatus Adiutrix sp.]